MYRNVSFIKYTGERNSCGHSYLMWGETFGRDVLFLLWVVVAEFEVLALSVIKDDNTVKTWIVRAPRSRGRCSGIAFPSLTMRLFEYHEEPQSAQFGVDYTSKGLRTKSLLLPEMKFL